MSDFVSGFWSVYTAALTLAGIVACAVLLKVMSSKRKAADAKPDLHGHVWDEDLAEYDNPLPRWWMWLFYITIVFGLAYVGTARRSASISSRGWRSWPRTRKHLPQGNGCSLTIARNAMGRMHAEESAFPTCATRTGCTAEIRKPSRQASWTAAMA